MGYVCLFAIASSVILFLGIGLYLFDLWLKYDEDKFDAVITFKQFLTFYELNPSQYHLYENNPQRRGFRSSLQIGFSFWDYLKYRRFRKKIIQKEWDERYTSKLTKGTQLLIDAVKHDITTMEKQSQDEISSAQIMMEKATGISEGKYEDSQTTDNG